MNIQQLMQQAQKMQKKMGKIEEEFKSEIFSSEAGGGAVKVSMSGDMKLTDVSVDEDLMTGEDREMLQDLFVAAVNSVLEKVKQKKESRMSGVMGKMGGMPGMPGLF